MKTKENCNGTKTHYFGCDEHPGHDKIAELIGGSGMPCTTTIGTDRVVPRGSVLLCDDLGHVRGSSVINTSATEVYHSGCRLGTGHFIVGDAVVLCALPLQDTDPAK